MSIWWGLEIMLGEATDDYQFSLSNGVNVNTGYMYSCTYQISVVVYRITQRRWTWTGNFKCREVKTGFYRNRWMQTGSSGTLIGWKSGQTTFVPLWDWMEGAWLRTLFLCTISRNVYRGNLQASAVLVLLLKRTVAWERKNIFFTHADSAIKKCVFACSASTVTFENCRSIFVCWACA